MPWKSSDVDKFKKGLSDSDKNKWVAVANASLAKCNAEGGDVLKCEENAIRIANAKFSADHAIHETKYTHEIEDDGVVQRETMLTFATQPAEISDGFQMVIPVGVFYDDWYGEIIITNTFLEMMKQNWEEKVLGKTEPFVDTEHDFGKANGWIEDLDARDDGLFAKINWTKMGRENIEEQYYRFFSAALGSTMHTESGERKFPVLFAVSLCNNPVMDTMDPAHLSRATPPGRGRGSIHIEGGVNNDPQGNSYSTVLGKFRRKRDSYRFGQNQSGRVYRPRTR